MLGNLMLRPYRSTSHRLPRSHLAYLLQRLRRSHLETRLGHYDNRTDVVLQNRTDHERASIH